MSRVEESFITRPDYKQLKEAVSRRISDTVLGYPQDKTGIIERRPIQHTLVDFLGSRLTKELQVTGQENLEIMRNLATEGKRIAIVPDHEAHMDAAAIDQSLDVTLNRDLSDRLVFALGIRLERGLFSQPVVRSQNIIRIWPPTENPRTPEEKEVKNLLSRSAPEDLRTALDTGRIPVIFPQGTRAGADQVMLPARASVIAVFDEIDVDYIFPVALQGTQNILPRGGRPQRGSYSVTYCDPIDYHALQDEHSDKHSKRYREAMMDAIMIPIAAVHPENQRGPYATKV